MHGNYQFSVNSKAAGNGSIQDVHLICRADRSVSSPLMDLIWCHSAHRYWKKCINLIRQDLSARPAIDQRFYIMNVHNEQRYGSFFHSSTMDETSMEKTSTGSTS